ncbi:hypothetical protein Tco_1514258, partial [Tanacetum coccineum]
MISKCCRHSCFDQLLNTAAVIRAAAAATAAAVAAATLATTKVLFGGILHNYQRPRDHLHESGLYPEVPESVPMPLTTVLVVTKHVQSLSPSVTPVRRYCNPASGYVSYMLAAHSELLYSTQWNVPKPLGKLGPFDPIVMQSHSETVYPRPICQPSDISESACPEYPRSQHKYPECPAPAPQRARSPYHLLYSLCLGEAIELSPTSYLDVGAVRHNLLRGGSLASGVSSLRSTGGGMNSEAGNGGSGDNGNGNDVGTCGGKCSDDGGGGSGGEGI